MYVHQYIINQTPLIASILLCATVIDTTDNKNNIKKQKSHILFLKYLFISSDFNLQILLPMVHFRPTSPHISS